MTKEELPLPESPLIRRIEVCREAQTKKVKAYEFQIPCAKCGKTLSERTAWEVIGWKYITDKVGARSLVRVYRLLCTTHAKRAIKWYENCLATKQ